MTQKFLVMFGLAIGSTLGGFVPALWGDSSFSGLGIIFTFIGGALGIWIGYRMGENLE